MNIVSKVMEKSWKSHGNLFGKNVYEPCNTHIKMFQMGNSVFCCSNAGGSGSGSLTARLEVCTGLNWSPNPTRARDRLTRPERHREQVSGQMDAGNAVQFNWWLRHHRRSFGVLCHFFLQIFAQIGGIFCTALREMYFFTINASVKHDYFKISENNADVFQKKIYHRLTTLELAAGLSIKLSSYKSISLWRK